VLNHKKPRLDPKNGSGEDGDFSRAFDVGDKQIFGHHTVPGHIGHDRIRQRGDHDRTDRQPIEPVRQIDGVGAADNDKNDEHDVEPAEVRREKFEERHAEFRRIAGQRVEKDADGQRDQNLAGEFLCRREALSIGA
jgi:hypothetical protein